MLILIMSALVAAPSSQANDSLATFQPSGLSFSKSGSIQMVSEELTISLEETRVRYRFLNTSSDDVTSVVAFPLPAISTETPYAVQVTASNEPYHPFSNPFGFQVSVDGKAISPKLELTHTFYGPKSPVVTKITLENPSPNAEIPSLRGDTSALEYKYYWEQRFAGGRETVIEHRYKTSPGTTVIDPKGKHAGDITPGGPYCYDSAFITGFHRYLDRLKTLPAVAAEAKADTAGDLDRAMSLYMYFHSIFDVKYILSTGANWKGPIQHFKLTLEKGDPKTLISTCFKGLKKSGDASFVAEFANYVPQEDLSVLFVKAP